MFKSKSRNVANEHGYTGDVLRYGAQSGGALTSLSPNYGNETWWLNFDLQGSALRNIAVASPQITGEEFITWESKVGRQYKACTHVVTERVNLPYSMLHRNYLYTTQGYRTCFMRQPTPVKSLRTLKGIVHPDVDYQAARARAWHNMQPRFEGKVSVLNFLYELKDFRDIAKYLFKSDNRPVLRDLRKLFSKRRPNLMPKDPSAGIATGILINNFMVQPLIKDISAMMLQASIIVREAQQQFDADGSTWQKSHYSEEIYRDETTTVGANNYYWLKTGIQNTTKFTATLRYQYDYTMRDIVDAWMKYWGLCGSFEAWWNMIPFSFLVDYFVQVGNSIHAMEHDPNVDLLQYEYGESLLTEYCDGVLTTGDPRHYELVLNGKSFSTARGDRIRDRLIAGSRGSIFTREPRTPYYGPATPRLKWPSSTQTLNMVALLRCLL